MLNLRHKSSSDNIYNFCSIKDIPQLQGDLICFLWEHLVSKWVLNREIFYIYFSWIKYHGSNLSLVLILLLLAKIGNWSKHTRVLRPSPKGIHVPEVNRKNFDKCISSNYIIIIGNLPTLPGTIKSWPTIRCAHAINI